MLDATHDALHSSVMSARKPPPHKERVTVSLRLPKWMVEWLDGCGFNRTEAIETAIRKFFKLKEPK